MTPGRDPDQAAGLDSRQCARPGLRTQLRQRLGTWLEQIGRCYDYEYTAAGALPQDDGPNRWDGRALDPAELYIVNGVSEIERFLSRRAGAQ